MFGGIGMQEILIILFIFLLVFGAKRLPELGQALGKGIREFKRSVSDIEEELKGDTRTERTRARIPERKQLEEGSADDQVTIVEPEKEREKSKQG
jgi:sec-independent protein translocase protein TatA